MENLLINAAKYNTGKTIDIKIRPGEDKYVDLSISNYSTPFNFFFQLDTLPIRDKIG